MSEPIRVLLVDDERLVLSSLRRLLARAGFEVQTCGSGAEALALLEKEPIDLIVSDYKMPGMNGIEFLARVAPRWPGTLRCMLTAQADREVLEESIRNGVLHRTFRKPWDNRELVADLQALAAGSL